MDVILGEEKRNITQSSNHQLMQCTNSLKPKADADEIVEVDIVDLKDHGGGIGPKTEPAIYDTSESMSSFGNTVSDTDRASLVSDNEVESVFCDRGALNSMFGNYGGAFGTRRKKLTDHWRRFIRPLMWRCKWIELQLKEFQCQALKYDRELDEDEQRKLCDYKRLTVEGEGTRCLPSPSCFQRQKIMNRKKRKKIEVKTDAASYMLQHKLLSYNEKKKSTVNGSSMDDYHSSYENMTKGNDDFQRQDGWPSLRLREGDYVSEEVLQKIEAVQSQVRELKAQIDKVISENAAKFSSFNSLSSAAPSDAFTSSDQNIASHPENGDSMSVTSLHILSQPENKVGELNPESTAVTSCGEDTALSDMIDSIVQTQAAAADVLDSKIEDPTERHDAQLSGSDSPTDLSISRAGEYLQWPRSGAPSRKRKRGRERSHGGWQSQKS